MSVSTGVSSVWIAALLAPYALNNLEDADPMFIGKTTADGKWLLQQYTAAGEMTYANVSNNPGALSYVDAWTGRAGLTYGRFETLTGV